MTSLFGGKRILKSDLQIEAYGAVDELSSHLGILISKIEDKEDKRLLTEIQNDLYHIMAVLAGAGTDISGHRDKVKKIERKIDKISTKLPKLNGFILPQGTETASFFQVARTVGRRAERCVVRYFEEMKIENWRLEIVQYLNRLSDLLFVMARFYNLGKDILTS